MGGRRKAAQADPRRLSLRLRLTLLYLSLMGLAFLVLGLFVYTSLRRIMLGSIDRALERELTEVLQEDLVWERDGPVLADPQDGPEGALRSREEGLLEEPFVRLVPADGRPAVGPDPQARAPLWLPPSGGFSTKQADGGLWRVYSRPLAGPAGATAAWLEAVHSLEFMQDTLRRLLRYLLAGFPALLVVSGAAGSLLSGRLLRPLVRITKTAGSIDGNDLSRRIAYGGSTTEIADLAASFDRMLDRLESAFARERRFTSDAAHELRTPLTALKGQIEVALARTRAAAEYRATLAGLQQYVDRMIRLAGDLLLMAGMERGASDWQPVRVALGDLLEAVAEQMEPLARGRRVDLAVRGSAPAVRGDMDQLIRLFLNLMDNAVKYTPEGGSIGIELGCGDGLASVAVRNTGPGIPAEDLPFIFDRFYRVGADRSRSTGGAGLGLAIAREIARKHGGRILAESLPGVSTTFTVLLPLDSGPGR